MSEMDRRSALQERATCECISTKIAIIAIADATESSGASIEEALKVFDRIIDPNCIGPQERENSREGCLPELCMHQNGPRYLVDQAAIIRANSL